MVSYHKEELIVSFNIEKIRREDWPIDNIKRDLAIGDGWRSFIAGINIMATETIRPANVICNSLRPNVVVGFCESSS